LDSDCTDECSSNSSSSITRYRAQRGPVRVYLVERDRASRQTPLVCMVQGLRHLPFVTLATLHGDTSATQVRQSDARLTHDESSSHVPSTYLRYSSANSGRERVIRSSASCWLTDRTILALNEDDEVDDANDRCRCWSRAFSELADTVGVRVPTLDPDAPLPPLLLLRCCGGCSSGSVGVRASDARRDDRESVSRSSSVSIKSPSEPSPSSRRNKLLSCECCCCCWLLCFCSSSMLTKPCGRADVT